MKCPDCTDGTGVAGFVDFADGTAAQNVTLKCTRCNGTNVVSDDMLLWIEEGNRLRNERGKQGLNLVEVADRLGLTITELSQMERGCIEPYTLRGKQKRETPMDENTKRDAEARVREGLYRHGFDRMGPDILLDGDAVTGLPCRCMWASEYHGDQCPEHGKTGSSIVDWVNNQSAAQRHALTTADLVSAAEARWRTTLGDWRLYPFSNAPAVAKVLADAYIRLLDTIREVHSEHGDDLCWMPADVNKIFVAAGLPPQDLRVGDKAAMLKNCERYVATLKEGGLWPTYAELEAELAALKAAQCDMKG